MKLPHRNPHNLFFDCEAARSGVSNHFSAVNRLSVDIGGERRAFFDIYLVEFVRILYLLAETVVELVVFVDAVNEESFEEVCLEPADPLYDLDGFEFFEGHVLFGSPVE